MLQEQGQLLPRGKAVLHIQLLPRQAEKALIHGPVPAQQGVHIHGQVAVQAAAATLTADRAAALAGAAHIVHPVGAAVLAGVPTVRQAEAQVAAPTVRQAEVAVHQVAAPVVHQVAAVVRVAVAHHVGKIFSDTLQ